jgi:hypothetical protein
MLDDDAKAILKIRLPGYIPSKKYPTIPKRLSKDCSQKTLRALRKHAVQKGKLLNPYGRASCLKDDTKDHKEWRTGAMKRRRLKLQKKQAIALEAHELQRLAREHATVAMEALIDIVQNPRAPEATRIAASSVILDRGYGKASQTSITANIGNGKTKEITTDELDKRVTSALRRVEELTDRTPKAGTSEKRPANLRILN